MYLFFYLFLILCSLFKLSYISFGNYIMVLCESCKTFLE